MRSALATTILETKDLEIVPEVVPEWKDKDGNPITVYVHQLDAGESIEWSKAGSAAQSVKETEDDGMFIIFCFAVRDAEGNRLFEVEDVPALRKKNFHVFNRLQRVALRLNRRDAVGELALKKD